MVARNAPRWWASSRRSASCARTWPLRVFGLEGRSSLMRAGDPAVHVEIVAVDQLRLCNARAAGDAIHHPRQQLGPAVVGRAGAVIDDGRARAGAPHAVRVGRVASRPIRTVTRAPPSGLPPRVTSRAGSLRASRARSTASPSGPAAEHDMQSAGHASSRASRSA